MTAPQAKRLSEDELAKCWAYLDSLTKYADSQGYEYPDSVLHLIALRKHLLAEKAAAAAREEQVRELVAEAKKAVEYGLIADSEIDRKMAAALVALNPTGDSDD
jgi:hypothetical protein